MILSHFCKQCGPRSDCSFRSSLIWVHTVCRYAKNRFEKFARIFSRRHKQTTFSDAVFLGALRVKGSFGIESFIQTTYFWQNRTTWPLYQVSFLKPQNFQWLLFQHHMNSAVFKQGQRKLIIRFLSPPAPKNSDQIKNFEVENFFRDNRTFEENRFYTTFKNCKWIIVMKRVLKQGFLLFIHGS